MKKEYEQPSVEVIDFQAEDIVTDEEPSFSNVGEGTEPGDKFFD